jgi:hypothetical protein
MVTASQDFLSQPRLRPGLRLVNWVGGQLRPLGLPLTDLSEQGILAAARRRTGLSDWGDERFRVALRLLLEDYNADPDLTFLGRALLREMLIRFLVNRLRVQNDLKQHPEIVNTPIRRPLFVVGLPRTGTTLLHHLLSLDPTGRPLLFWESMSPSPPPEERTRANDPRIGQARRLLRRLRWAAPSVSVVHEVEACGPEECVGLLYHTFVSPVFWGRLPRYRRWLEELDDAEVLAAYREYRQQLQLLQWHCSQRRWVLKYPDHLYGLAALLALFPDGCIIQTHRDPIEAVPSACSSHVLMDALVYQPLDLKEVGQRVMGLTKLRIERCLRARQAGDGGRIYDLHYRDLVNDPVAAVRGIYHHFRFPLTSELEEKIRAYLAANPQHKHGVHRYTLEEFGLNREQVRREFAPYYERFQIDRR